MTSIRKARERDIHGLLDCQARVWESLRGVLPTPWVEDEIARCHQPDVKDILRKIITDQTRITLLAEENHAIVGFALGRTDNGGLSWLGFMGVRPAHRRQGIGRKLLQAYLTESKMNGAHKVSLNTLRHWKATIEYHKTKDILHVKQMLGHRNIECTMVYTQLAKFEDTEEFTCRIAKELDEAKELIEAGFEYVTDMPHYKLFRKRK